MALREHGSPLHVVTISIPAFGHVLPRPLPPQTTIYVLQALPVLGVALLLAERGHRVICCCIHWSLNSHMVLGTGHIRHQSLLRTSFSRDASTSQPHVTASLRRRCACGRA